VLAWGTPRLRDLPWRRTRDPWQVLVAEVMLQQTQVERVIPKWLAFLDAFPTPAACAAASLGDVLRLWQGLGYPRRARNLQAAASLCVERHEGRLPCELVELLALPGVGPYTARAVRVFAFEYDDAVVDTNIARVYARWVGERLTPRDVQAIADASVVMGEGWAWNQVLMDLGAQLCRPRNPGCSECPLAATCAWTVAGRPEPDPATGSAGVSTRQAPFEGSDRQARGRLMAALSRGAISDEALAEVMGCPAARARRLASDLVGDRLVVVAGGRYRLP
jgi:A/G-specific adenine glycosylase